MMPGEHDQYGLEPDASLPPRADQEPAPRAGIPRPEFIEPLPLEEQEPVSRRSTVKDLDVCPNCGASMRGTEQLVCIRCGFDLKTMQQVRTVTGEATVPSDDTSETEQPSPLIKQDQLGFWAPIAIASVAGIILLICYLAGVQALYPQLIAVAAEQNRAIEISFTARLEAVLQLIIFVVMLTGCGMGALAFLAYLNGMRLARTMEDLKLGALRMLAIVTAMQLAALIALPPPALEWTIEAVLQLVIFAGLTLALFRLNPRDLPTVTGSAVVLFLLLWLGANVIVWATGA